MNATRQSGDTDGAANALPDPVDVVASFLRSLPPFDALDAGVLRAVADATSMKGYRRGSTIIAQGGDPARALFVEGAQRH